MRKKATSYCLSQDILDEIEQYRIENRIATKSQALERMLLERRFMLQGMGVGLGNEKPVVTKVTKPVTKPKKSIRKTIDDIMDNMPD